MSKEGFATSDSTSAKEVRVDIASLTLRPIRRDEELRWNGLMSKHHYLGFRSLTGEALKYVAELGGEWVALLGWGAGVLKCRPRDRWIGWSSEERQKRLRYVVNNQRFLILPWVRVKNLASKALSLNTKRLCADWEAIYNHKVVLAETFVDPARFAGTCYKASGWLPLGKTRGFGRKGGRYYWHGASKVIFVRPLRRDAVRLLSSPFLSKELSGGEKPMIDIEAATINEKDGLLDRLDTINDPRKLRGIRHNQTSILAVAICAVLCGARSFVAIEEWAKDLSQDMLRRLRCRRDPNTGKFIPPSEPTIRRMLQSVDPDEVDRVIANWLFEQCNGDAIAIDGKTLRGSKTRNGKAVHLMGALLHKEGVVISQQQVCDKSNEITAEEPLLDPLNLKGKVITADAMHTQVRHAKYLKEKKGADYVFTVKANQKTMLSDIEKLGDEDFSPSVH